MAWKHYCTMTVDGAPKGQPRPKAVNRGTHAGVYDPGTAKGWKERVFYDTRPHRPPSPFAGPVRLDIHFKMPRPKRLMRKCDPDGEIAFTSKPDIDNLAKAVLDSMENCGWFVNDSYVTAGFLEKAYHKKGALAHAVIKVWVWRG